MNNQSILDKYSEVAGQDVVNHLRQLADSLKGIKVVHVNSTRVGGGVAEILHKMVPLMRELEIDTTWEVIEGKPEFYECTKKFHNAIQGDKTDITRDNLEAYEETNRKTSERLRDDLEKADFVIIHDPQPAALIKDFTVSRKGKWVWRCHIDASRPFRPVWRYLSNFVKHYDASIFSLSNFAQRLPHPNYIIPPSIDPLHEKNIELDESEVNDVFNKFNLDPERPIILQVSRFDRFKDPVGVIKAYKLVKSFRPGVQLVLAGGTATDDPEGEIVLNEVHAETGDDPNIKILPLPSDAHRAINALQRCADIVLQKSLKEGFGLTVTEAMWKKKPVIGGDTGGIRIQVVNHHTGFLVNTPEGAALRIRYLLNNLTTSREMGEKAHNFVRENFLITRQLREYLTLIHAIFHNKQERIILN